MWIDSGSAIAQWQVGEVVDYRNGSWRVLGRVEDSESVSLTLGSLDQARLSRENDRTPSGEGVSAGQRKQGEPGRL
jgi:hypothetical protein